MKPYISKAAVVAAIESIIDTLEKNSGYTGAIGDYQMAICGKILSLIETLEVKEALPNEEKIVVLLSYHQSVASLSVGNLNHVYCMVGNPNAEDLLKVVDVDGNEYWCDELLFTED